ncbi:uncharacterized protein [Lepeophtheirus salmonis]|nr:myb-like protein AA isoform X2 [Lepeophtheirus salmonis]
MPGIESSMEESPANRIYTMEHYRSSESLEDRHSNASSTESQRQVLDNYVRKDHEFIPTRMKTITASKPAANPGQFTKIPSNPLLLSAQSQMMKVEQVKKTKEVVRKTEEEPDWQSNLNVWKDRRRKQSEDALLRVAEIKKVDDDPSMDTGLEKRKLSLGKKLSSLVHNDEDEDWLGPVTRNGFRTESHPNISTHRSLSTSAMPNTPAVHPPPPPVSTLPAAQYKEVREEPRRKMSPKRSRSTGVLMSSEEIKQTTEAAQLQSQPLRRKSSELSMTMKNRLEAFEIVQEDNNPPVSSSSVPKNNIIITNNNTNMSSSTMKSSNPVPPDETFRQKLESFKEKEIEKEEAKYIPPKKSITDFLNPPDLQNSLGSSGGGVMSSGSSHNISSYSSQDVEDEDDVDKLLDDALEESYRSVLEDDSPYHQSSNHPNSPHNISSSSSTSAKSVYSFEDFSPSSGPPKEKPPPPPTEPPPGSNTPHSSSHNYSSSFHSTVKNRGNVDSPDYRQERIHEVVKDEMNNRAKMDEEEMDKQERDIIASLEVEEKEHLKYMESVSSMKNISLNSNSHNIPITTITSSTTNISGPIQKSASSSHKQHSPLHNKHNPYEDSPKKKSQNSSERNINNHWLIQEAEQRRITEMQQQPPSRNLANNATISQNKTSPSNHYGQSRNNGGGGGHNNNSHTYENSVEIRNNKANLHHQSPPQPQPQQPTIPNHNNSSSSSMHYSKQATTTTTVAQQQQQPIYNNYPPANNSYSYENTYANVQQPPPPSQQQQQHPPQQLQQQQINHSPPGHNNNNNYPTMSMRESINNSNNHTNSNVRVPGPQVPPRNMENPDRMLSVSGKKKCSHCREELGRGAAMIIESLRLYYHLRCFQCCVCQIQLGNGTAGTDVRVRNNKLHCQNCYSNDDGLKFSKV